MIQGVAAKWSFSSLSANKGVNQQVMRFTPFYTPENLIATKTTPKTKNFTIWMWRADYHCSSFGGFCPRFGSLFTILSKSLSSCAISLWR